MFRIVCRSAGLVAIALAFALLVKDATRSLAGGELALTPLGLDVNTLFPAKFAQLQPLLERNLHPLLWDPVAVTLLRLPTWLALGAVGALLFYVLRPREQRIGAWR